MQHRLCFQLLFCIVFACTTADFRLFHMFQSLCKCRPGTELYNFFFQHNYIQVSFLVYILLTASLLGVLPPFGTYFLPKIIHILTDCYIETHTTGVCLYFLQSSAFPCEKSLCTSRKNKLKIMFSIMKIPTNEGVFILLNLIEEI